MYRLNPDADIRTDLDNFHKYAKKGLAGTFDFSAVEYLLKAASLLQRSTIRREIGYRLDSWKNVNGWNNYYIQVMERLAQTYTRLREFGKTVYWAEKLLRIDHTWEEAYRLLMFAHYQLQNRPQAVKWYQKCKKVLKKNFQLNRWKRLNRCIR